MARDGKHWVAGGRVHAKRKQEGIKRRRTVLVLLESCNFDYIWRIATLAIGRGVISICCLRWDCRYLAQGSPFRFPHARRATRSRAQLSELHWCFLFGAYTFFGTCSLVALAQPFYTRALFQVAPVSYSLLTFLCVSFYRIGSVRASGML